MMRLFYTALCAFNDYTCAKAELPEHFERETFAELRTDREIAISRLNENLQYFCFLSIPENGLNSYIEASQNMVRLFRMHSPKIISKRLDIPVEKVQKIMDQLDRFGLVWRVSAELDDEPTILYGFTHNTPLTLLLTLAQSMTNYIQFVEPFVDR